MVSLHKMAELLQLMKQLETVMSSEIEEMEATDTDGGNDGMDD